jgi:predicted lipoprotein with Yx(FWY)xxD motif
MRVNGVVGAVVAAMLLGSGGAARAADDEVKVEKSAEHGSYLADGKGMALYLFKKDAKGKSVCAGPCVESWPLFQAENVKVQSGEVKASDFATITREDGQKQTTYKGMPLYYFVKDKKPGDTTGHGVKEVWILATP